MSSVHVIHPKKFVINGYTICVATPAPITNRQAAKIAMHAFHSREWTAQDRNQEHTHFWGGNPDTPELPE